MIRLPASRRRRLVTVLAWLLASLTASASLAPAAEREARPRRLPAPLQQMLQHGEDEEPFVPPRWRESSSRVPAWRAPLERAQLVPPLPYEARAPHPAVLEEVRSLGPDVRVSTRVPATCPGCGNGSGLIGQVEPSVAILGDHVLVSYNENLSRCTGLGYGRQNVSFSMDGGRTFRELKRVPSFPLLQNGLHGDPSVAVNAKTGTFYAAGFGINPDVTVFQSGIGIARGHFADTTFVFDDGQATTLGAADDFYDKPWMTVDSVSSNVYLAWTSFPDIGLSRTMFRRFAATLEPLGEKVLLSRPDNDFSGTQFPIPITGPDGELYVGWYEVYGQDFDHQRCRIIVRRSDDGGASFGPPVTAVGYDGNFWNGAPGMLRRFGPATISFAIDRSQGPHRGRLYVAWDEARPYVDHRFPDSTSAIEVEPNDTPALALPFVPGGKLRGSKSGQESDFYRLSLRRGETFFLLGDYDTTGVDCHVRMWAQAGAGSPLELVANATAYAGGMLFSAPADADYLLEVYGTNAITSRYMLRTALHPVLTGEGARDHRDQMVAWSDDGTHWSTPRRVNDSPPGFDGIYPSLAVDGRGRVHCFWIDFREDTLTGSHSVPYVASSGDGGVTWGANRRLGDARSTWPLNLCVSNANSQGDYAHAAADGDRVVSVFTDGREGDPDIYADVTEDVLLAVPADRVEVPEASDTTVTLALVNAGNHERMLAWRVEDEKGWLLGASPGLVGERTLAVGETLAVTIRFGAQSCAGDSQLVRLVASDLAVPGAEDRTAALVRCGAPRPVPGAPVLALGRIHPHPADREITVEISLPDDSAVTLELYDLQGRLVARERRADLGPGSHSVPLRMPATVQAGVYSLRLRHASGQPRRTLVVVH